MPNKRQLAQDKLEKCGIDAGLIFGPRGDEDIPEPDIEILRGKLTKVRPEPTMSSEEVEDFILAHDCDEIRKKLYPDSSA